MPISAVVVLVGSAVGVGADPHVKRQPAEWVIDPAASHAVAAGPRREDVIAAIRAGWTYTPTRPEQAVRTAGPG